MRTVYEAVDNIEAYMLKGMLENDGIMATIDHEYQQEGITGINLTGFVRISVPNDDVEDALKILRAWEKKNPLDKPMPREQAKADFFIPFMSGVLVGLAIGVFLVNT